MRSKQEFSHIMIYQQREESLRAGLLRWVFKHIIIWIAFLCFSQQVSAEPSSAPLPDELAQQGNMLFQKGAELLKQWKYQPALETFQAARPLFRQAHDSQMEAETLVQIGYTQALAGEYQQALESFEQALVIFRKMVNREDEAGTLTYEGIVHTMYSRYEQALPVFEQALSLTEETDDQQVAGVTLNRIGETYGRLGRFFEARVFYQQALQLARELDDPLLEGATLASLGNIYTELGQSAEAFQTYRQALPILLQEKDRQGVANIYLSMGAAYFRLGDYQKALEHFASAREQFQAIPDQRGEATALTGAGLVYDYKCQETPNYCLKAMTTYQTALALRKAAADLGGQAATLHNLGGVCERLGRETNHPAYLRQALPYYLESLRITQEIGERSLQARTLNNTGELHLHLSSYEEPAFHLEQALTALRQALVLQQAAGERAQEWVTRSNIARVYELQERPEEALATYMQALEILDGILIDTGGIDEFKISLEAKAAQTYQWVILLLMGQGEPEQAFALSERARARVLLDQLGNVRLQAQRNRNGVLEQQEHALRQELAELEQRLQAQRAYAPEVQDTELIEELQQIRDQKRAAYEDLLLQIKLSNPEYVSLVRVEPLPLADLQHLLDQDTTLLSYVVTPRRTLAFIITQNTFRAVEMPVGEQQLKTAIAKARRPPVDPHAPPPEILKALYADLITPLKPYLNTSKIGIIPHRVLHYLPFAALTDGPRYFGETYTLFALPGASVLEFVLQKRKSGAGNILALAYSEPEGYPPLFYADQEVKAVAKLRQTSVFTGSEAAESLLKARAGAFSVLHLAAHGELNTANPLFSRIVLAPDGENEGMLEVHEVYTLNLQQTGLVVLSACSTQLGRLSRGDDIIGLTRAFLYAGAPAVIASLWNVDDQATSALMTTFYARLKRGDSQAEALQHAQIRTRKTYPHPYYWAAFVLTGDPGTAINPFPWGRIFIFGIIIGAVVALLLLRNYYICS